MCADGLKSPCNAFELSDEIRYFSVIAARKEDLYRAREQQDTSQFVFAWLCQSRSDRFGGSHDISAFELEERQARLAVCAAGPGMLKGPPCEARFAQGEMDEAEFEVGDPGVEEVGF
jgi:hypothetical protein